MSANGIGSVTTDVKPTVVLVHGGFVDGAGWEGVYSILRKDGYDVSIVQNSTLSLAGDVAATRQVIAQANGPVVLVGHSYGGVVITEAGNDRRSKLVYIAAFAPGQGRVRRFADQGPGARRSGAADPAAAGRLPVPRQGEVRGVVCRRRRTGEGRVHGRLAGTVGRCCARGSGKRAGVEDEAELVPRRNRRQDDPAAAQRFMSKRAGAKVTESAGSHAIYVSRPDDVASLIKKAAQA